jgi:uncharacterized membrane protein YedE/YeeE
MANKKANRLSWWMGGILMSLLLLLTFSIYGADRPIGASTYVPYFAGVLFGLDPEQYTYLDKVKNAGSWEGILLLGALFGGFVTSVFITKTFRLTLIPSGWKQYKNNSIVSRLSWSFFSGFIMIIGARLAGGCTSGHFLSGMSQLAMSAMVFGGVVMATLLISGRLFYNVKG